MHPLLRASLRIGIVAVVFTASAGCAESVKAVADKHRAASQPKLDKLKALAAAAQQQPPVIRDSFDLPPGVTLDFSQQVDRKDQHNALSVNVMYLADPCNADDQPWTPDPLPPGRDNYFRPPLDQSELLRGPGCVLARGPDAWGEQSPLVLNDAFIRMEKMLYVLVLRVRRAVRPVLPPTEMEAPKVETFIAGEIEGDALLYEIESGKYLGGMALDIRSKEKTMVRARAVADQLRSQLLQDASNTLYKKILELNPGSQPPS